MSGKNVRVTPLASRKQLLIAESELNRAQLVWEWEAVTDDVHAITHQAQTVGSLAASVATLVAGLASSRREKSAATGRPAWLQTILQGADLVSSIWSEFRPRPKS